MKSTKQPAMRRSDKHRPHNCTQKRMAIVSAPAVASRGIYPVMWVNIENGTKTIRAYQITRCFAVHRTPDVNQIYGRNCGHHKSGWVVTHIQSGLRAWPIPEIFKVARCRTMRYAVLVAEAFEAAGYWERIRTPRDAWPLLGHIRLALRRRGLLPEKLVRSVG